MSGLKITVIRRGTSLVPSCAMFEEDLLTIPDGKEVVITLTRSRSPQHLRRFFAKLRVIRKSGAWDSDEESLLGYLKLGIGYVTAVIDQTSMMVSSAMLGLAETMVAKYHAGSDEGRLARFVISLAGPRTYLVPKSIAFESLDQNGFNDFERSADKFIAEKFGIDAEELMRQAVKIGASPVDREAAPAEPIRQDNKRSPLEARLRALADTLRKDTPEEFDAVLSQIRVTGRLRALEADAPKQTAHLIKLCAQASGGLFNDVEFEEVLGKIVAPASQARAA